MKQKTTPSAPALSFVEIHFQYHMLNRLGEIVDRSEGKAFQFDEVLTSGISIPMISIPGGIFQMGSASGQGYEDEHPRHLVSLAPFLLGKHPVTQAEWQAVMGKAAQGRFHGADLPVENISWRAALAFCRRLKALSGRPYHLPSEAQWEYACRGDTTTAFNTGPTITTDYANYVGEHTFLDEHPGVYRHTTTLSGSFPPNPFGLFDMHGNLWEFCADRWHPDYTGAPFDGAAWDVNGEEGFRVARGGSWHEPPANCRSAIRLRVAENDWDDFYGFRICL